MDRSSSFASYGLFALAVSALFACGGGAGSSAFGEADSGTDASLGTLHDASHKDSTTPVLGNPDGGMTTIHADAGCSSGITCASANVQCGPLANGCGGMIQCGACPTGQTCGGGGTASVCGSPCVPMTCAGQGIHCGPAGDGCGNSLSCGGCSDAETCGGGGTASVCGSAAACVPTTCAALGFTCGPAGDGCGNSLDCGTCTSPDICGGGAVASQCGTPPCVPTTCAAIGAATCGPVGDGCGGVLQCGTCTTPETCGGLTPGQCGIPSTCTNLCKQQVACSAPGTTTTITGTVYAPNGVDPLPNVLVYIPNSAVQAFTPGVECDQCSNGVSGSPLVSAATDTFGHFTLQNAPVGTKIPLVLQTGRWRRQTVIPTVTACTDNALPTCTAATATSGACLTSLPQTKAQGDIPHMAFATGSIDALECVIRKIGVADSEFTNPGGAGRINLYVGFLGFDQFGDATAVGGAQMNSSTPSESQLVGSLSTMSEYDMVLFPCEAGELAAGQDVYDNPTNENYIGAWSSLQSGYQSNVIAYANAGGRIFNTHYSYVWLYNDAPFKGTANWDVSQTDSHTSTGYPPDQTGFINTTFPEGLELAEWLQNIGASTTQGQIALNTLRWDLSWGTTMGVVAPSELWMSIDDSKIGDVPMHYTFNTPVGTPAANQCGKVLFDDFHVEAVTTTDPYGNAGLDDGINFPNECTGTTATMTPQEKLLEFMIFDLGSCVSPAVPTCTPTTCTAQTINCGPADDGCGNLIQCGTCPAGETCGGGGTPSVCGAPTCTPTTCQKQNISCGPAGDGCGNALSCGTCPAGETCGGGGMPGVCGSGTCTPKTCAEQGLSCGPAGDGCGNALSCGSCAAGQTCGGGGKSGACGATCTPTTCVALGFNCGPAGDGCGNELNCGTCSAPETCGGGGTAGVCGGNIPK